MREKTTQPLVTTIILEKEHKQPNQPGNIEEAVCET